jgi:hypothetical protein
VASAQHLPIATEGNYDEPVKTAGLQAEIWTHNVSSTK